MTSKRASTNIVWDTITRIPCTRYESVNPNGFLYAYYKQYSSKETNFRNLQAKIPSL